MNLTPEEERIIEIIRARKMNFGKVTLVIQFSNWKIVNVGLGEKYETFDMRVKGSKI